MRASTQANESSPTKHERLNGVHSTRGMNEIEETPPYHASSSEKEPLSTIARQHQYRFRSMNSVRRRRCNNDSQSAFLEAIRLKNEDFASLLLAIGADPDSADVWGPAITQDLRAGLKKLSKALLARGADPDATDVWGPVLTQAIRADDIDLASKLLQRGACPNAEDVWGPALTQAIRGHNEQLTIMLVKYGANVEARDIWGSALAQSVRHNLHALTTVLLNTGNVPRVSDNRDQHVYSSKEDN